MCSSWTCFDLTAVLCIVRGTNTHFSKKKKNLKVTIISNTNVTNAMCMTFIFINISLLMFFPSDGLNYHLEYIC